MILLLAFFVSISAFEAQDISPNIVGGQDAVKGEFPYLVSLRAHRAHICGASILDSWHILTAAHCVADARPEELSIQYGTNVISEDAINSIDVIKITVHPNFDPDSMISDLAVLALKGVGIPLGDVASVVALPRQGQANPRNADAILAGWGYYVSGEGNLPPSEYLQKIQQKFYDDKTCASIFKEYTDPPNPRYQLCAGITDNETGGCQGDSGGPLTVNGVQFGIVSWGSQPCATGMPTVFTKVSNFVGWIKKQMLSKREQK